MAFAAAGKVIYGRAFDVVRIEGRGPVDIENYEAVCSNLKDIILYEVKSSNRDSLPDDFSGYFFALTTAELLVAQSLGAQFRFVFVNIATGALSELSLQQLYARARSIYPTWSVRF